MASGFWIAGPKPQATEIMHQHIRPMLRKPYQICSPHTSTAAGNGFFVERESLLRRSRSHVRRRKADAKAETACETDAQLRVHEQHKPARIDDGRNSASHAIL